MNERIKLMKRLHGYAKVLYNLDDPHPLLHQLAISEFEVESMGHLSEQELSILQSKLEQGQINWKKVEGLGITRIPEMGYKQQILVKRLQKELGWSEHYMYELTVKRYGYLHWKYLTGREAWAFCHYLIRRKREKDFARRNHGKEISA